MLDRLKCITIISVFIFLIAVPSLRAQWVVNGVPVSTEIEGQFRQQIAKDGAGGAIIAWQDERDRSGTYVDIYAQRLDADGHPLWLEDGIPICTAPDYQAVPVIVEDGAGGAIIAWIDKRSQSVTDDDIYAQRVDGYGNVLWIADGVPIVDLPEDQIRPRITTDGAGGAIVCWEDNRSTGDNIYAQRIDPAGNCLWTPGGIPVVTGTASWSQIASDYAGGAVITWMDDRNGYGNDDIFAQRIDPAGSPLWTAGGIPVCTASGNQLGMQGPAVTPDGLGGAFIAWMDERAGEVWATINTGLSHLDVRAFGESNDYLFTGTNGGGVYRSPDEGDTWENSSTGMTNLDTRALSYLYYYDEYVFAGTYGGGIFLSTDNGDNWAPANNGITNLNVLAIAAEYFEDILLAGTDGGGVFRSLDMGGLWEPVNTGLLNLHVQTLYMCSDSVFAGTAGGGVYRSGDYGDSWHEKNNLLTNLDVRAFVYDSYNDYLYAGTYGGGIYRSSDFGDSWAQVNTGLTNLNVCALAHNFYTHYIFAGTDGGGVYVTMDYGSSWTQVNTGLGNLDINVLKHEKYHTIYGGTRGGGIYRYSLNRDVYAQRIDAGGSGIGPADGVPVCTAIGNQEYIDITIDGTGGALITWKDERLGFNHEDVYAQKIDNLCGLLWTMDGVAVCTADKGQYYPKAVLDGLGGAILTWTDCRAAPIQFEDADIYAQRLDQNGNVLWQPNGVPICMAEYYQNMPELVSDEAGGAIIAWVVGEEGGGPISTFDIYALRVTGNGEIPVATLLQSHETFRDDSGVKIKWTLSEAGRNMEFFVFRTAASGGKFEELAVPVIEEEHLTYAFKDESCEPGTGYRYRIEVLDEDGRRTLFETDIITIPAVPLTLYQNHPNPFNPATIVEFYIPYDCHVTLDIYDAAGRPVTRLLDKVELRGTHKVEWNGLDARGTPVVSGVYFYRIKAGKENITRKMILIK